jgi:hypothetical protein
MSTRVKGNVVRNANRAEAVALANDNWIWTVIFTTTALTALTALTVAAIFTIAVG